MAWIQLGQRGTIMCTAHQPGGSSCACCDECQDNQAEHMAQAQGSPSRGSERVLKLVMISCLHAQSSTMEHLVCLHKKQHTQHILKPPLQRNAWLINVAPW